MSVGSAGGPAPPGNDAVDGALEAADSVAARITASTQAAAAASAGAAPGRNQVLAGVQARAASALPADDPDDAPPPPLSADGAQRYAKLDKLLLGDDPAQKQDHSADIYALLHDTPAADLDAIYSRTDPAQFMMGMRGTDRRSTLMLDLANSVGEGQNADHLASYVRWCQVDDFLSFVSRADDDLLQDFAATPDGKAALTKAASNLEGHFWLHQREYGQPVLNGEFTDIPKGSDLDEHAQDAAARLRRILAGA
jgi:hypothetical protein